MRRERSASTALLGLLFALVVLRSWVFVWFPHAHMDSDQAVYGLMSNDLVHARAFPVFMYGQRYLLAVTVWLCAPLTALLGPTIVALKLPVLAMNLAVVAMLWIGLRREGLAPGPTALSILPFAACAVVTASRLVAHEGGAIEPFFFIALAFFLQHRPILLGVVFGIAFMNREYALIGFIAMLLIDVAQGRLSQRWRGRLLSVGVIGVVWVCVRLLAQLSTDYRGGVVEAGGMTVGNVVWFFRQHLPTLMGDRRALGDFNITSSLTLGHAWLYTAWWVLFALGCVGARHLSRSSLGGMSTYLILVGLGQSAAFLLLIPGAEDFMLMRYVLLALFAAVGMVAWAWREPGLRPLTALVVLAAAGANTVDYLRLSREYVQHPPRHEKELLADALLARGIRYATADYWVAFDVTWLTAENVIITAPGDHDRVGRYRRAIAEHQPVVHIVDEPCHGGEPILRWYLCR